MFIIFATYFLGLWYGAKELVDDHEKNPNCVNEGNCGITGGQVLVSPPTPGTDTHSHTQPHTQRPGWACCSCTKRDCAAI
jgi:hypothetical protein